MTELQNLLQDLGDPRVWVEIAALIGCVAVAWGVGWLLARGSRQAHAAADGGAPRESVWFGRHVVDGVFFPLLALGLIYTARIVVGHYQPVAVLRLAVPVFLSLAVIRLTALVLAAVFPQSVALRQTARVVSWGVWLAAILWILGLLPPVLAELDNINLAFGKTNVSVRTLLEGTLSCVLVLIVALWISSTIEQRVLRTQVADLSVRKVVGNVIRTVLLLVGFLFALSTVGVDLTALSVLGGAVGVGLGFGLQKLASNYVSGFVILLERSLRIGDTVKVDGFEGVVSDIKTRYTVIRSAGGREAIVPNEKLITERVENLSLGDPRVLMSTQVSVAYDSQVGQVQGILVEAARASSRILQDPGPSAHLTAFGADGLEFTLWFWIVDPQNGQSNLRSEVNIRILDGLRAAGIDIPYPQRVVHLPEGVAVALPPPAPSPAPDAAPAA